MCKFKKYAFITVFLCVCSFTHCQEENRDKKQHPELSTLVQLWAQKLSGELWNFGELVTRKQEAIKSFKDTTIIKENGEAILKDIQEKVSKMMDDKVGAVKRIMDIAEQAAQREQNIDKYFQFYNAKNLTNSAPNDTQNDQHEEEDEDDDDSIGEPRSLTQREEFYGFQQDQEESSNSKEEEYGRIKGVIEAANESENDPQASQIPPNDKTKLPLYPNRHFYNIPVNTNYSAVHVPSNVYERYKEVISGIKWSEELDKTFRNNYKIDPTLSWQYFGSSTGFMRQFPAMIWSQEPIDLFDCRMRSWFIEAASSPKDIVILVDRSGSMTGMRREIARHVVHNILDTLGNNDYVNIYTFSNTTEPLVDCFDNFLVQANLANVRVLKEAMTSFKTEQIANFSLALVTAFELLQSYRNDKKGACCNQAIMLVTDGVQYNYKEIFEEYNWKHLPFMNVRVFTYLIGREVSDVREVKWMACANRGYYVHLSTYAEVREEVLQYIPVMARPMVLNASHKPNPTWSPVYADVTDPKLTNWLWVNRERNRQRERFQAYRRNKTFLTSNEFDKKFVEQQKNHQETFGAVQTYHLMTSVSLPVYDKKPRAERVANLLGVAGTDIPIEYIQRLMLPYRLGVNGYAFIVSNNGYILCHPDLRPVYKGILKPAYNQVDMIEIEIMDDEKEPRDFSSEILELRKNVIFQKKGNVTLQIKGHLDDMKRLYLGTRHYYYVGLNNTPFTLVVALPDKYGHYRVTHPVENDIHRLIVNKKIEKKPLKPLKDFFKGNWTIHPDWHYCRYLGDDHSFETPEQEFIYFLDLMEEVGWKWGKECDRKLICRVVADAKITSWFSQNITQNTKEGNGSEFIKRFGITVAFMATHSGLTRWQEFPQNIDSAGGESRHFHIYHNKAIDEVWYRRAVEHHYVDKDSYVYSVPFPSENDNRTVVTVAHAIFRDDKSVKAPVAVVGYQFYHHALYELFNKITSSCGEASSCKRTCESNELRCLLLDDNGYVIVSDNSEDTGYFFGDLRPDIMKQLVDENIYNPTNMYDYQGLCAESHEVASPASRLFTPWVHLSNLSKWLLTTLVTILRTVTGSDFETMSYPEVPTDANNPHKPEEIVNESGGEHEYEMETSDEPSYKLNEKEFDQRLTLKKTKPEPCDNQFWLYSLVHYTDKNISNSGYNKTMSDCTRPFIVQRVSWSNMILLVINNLCREDPEKIAPSPHPEKVDYNMTLACYRVTQNDLPRRHYMSCINRNINESEIKLCGAGTNISYSKILLALLVITNSCLLGKINSLL